MPPNGRPTDTVTPLHYRAFLKLQLKGYNKADNTVSSSGLKICMHQITT